MFSVASADFAKGFNSWAVAWMLAILRLKAQYRGSMLGPFWITLSSAAFFLGLGFIYSVLWKLEFFEFMPWLATGFIVWIAISNSVTESCNCFISAAPIIQNSNIPLTVIALRNAFSNLIFIAHLFPLLIFILPIAYSGPSLSLFLVPVSVLILILNVFLLSFVLGFICARYRDVLQVILTFLQVLFFLSPIIWKPDMLGQYEIFVYLNPVSAFIEIIRSPVLGIPIHAYAWPIVALFTTVNTLTALAFLNLYKNRLIFWL